jgi:hypothetical protein
LTDAQRQALRDNETDTLARLPTLERSESSDKRPLPQRRRELFHSAMDKSLSVLTPEQLKTWNAIVGQPFHGRLSTFLPGVFVEP